ncbi:MAG: ribosome small subunit-dependent GTPase A [Phycisphaerae bacterium]|nr:ribosome small subunit-dependent GTPase A [Phycisphaerae bacterium]
MDLTDLGWKPDLETLFEPYRQAGYAPGRVAREHRHLYGVLTEHGELMGEVSGRYRHEAVDRAGFPAVGDWVAVEPRHGQARATIHALLPRTSRFSRKVAGGVTEEQVVAANIDTVFLVNGLDGDLNPRRIERYLGLAWASGAAPVILLNKADLCDDVGAAVGRVEAVAIGVPIHPVSAACAEGLDALSVYLSRGRTVALLGSSGVGKSTLINRLLGVDRQRTQAVREDDSHGRHTTTCRELIPLPRGGCVIDTPGMRELQLWGDQAGASRTFEDVESLAARCRFRDCRHENEPGCAVREALAGGSLDPKRFESYVKLTKELNYLEMRQDHRAQSIERAKWKQIHKAARRWNKDKRRGM